MHADPSPARWRGRSVAVTGGAGFLGRPTVALLESLGADVRVVRSDRHDLRNPDSARDALARAEVVFHLAANVGGIGYNRRHPGELARDNLLIGTNVFEACRLAGVRKLVAACSVCAYPKGVSIPITEAELWSGYPEESNAAYGLAKRMLHVLARGYRSQWGLDSCVPAITNLYGPGDDFDLEDSHVIPAIVRKYVEAAARGDDRVTLWGSGEPTRDFLFVEDAARALLLCAERCEDSEPINLGSGDEVRIRDLAELVSDLAGFRGETVWDRSRPDGQPRRRLAVDRARERLGFEPRVGLEEGLGRTVRWFREHSSAGVALGAQ